MSDRGPFPEDASLELRLDKLLREYSARLDSLELALPVVGSPPEPPPAYLYKDYFAEEPAPAVSTPVLIEPEAPAPVPAPRQAPSAPASAAPLLPAAPAQPSQGPVARPFDRRAADKTAERFMRGALALTALAAAFGLWHLIGLLAQAPHRFFPLRGSQIAGLAGSGASLFADDGNRLLEIGATGAVRDAGPISGGRALGLARDDAGHFWTSSEGQDVLYEHDTDATRSVRKAYPYPRRRFAQIAIAGDTLWALDADSGAAYEYMLSRSLLGTSLTPISQFQGGPETARAAGLAVAQGLLWVCDPAQRRILRMRADGAGLAVVDALDLSPWVAPGARITGMTLAGGYLWVLTGWPAGIHRLRLDSLGWKSG